MKNIFYLFITLAFTFGLYSCNKDAGVNDAGGVTGTGGSMARFTISQNHLYVVTNTRLNVYDITNPSTPAFLKSITISNGIETIYPFKNKLFIGSNSAMYIYSIDDPTNPVYEGEATHVRACDPVVANDSMAFVTVRSGATCGGTVNALYAYDISSLTYPTLLSVTNLKNPHGLALNNQVLYVCDADDGMKIFNISNPTEPVYKGKKMGYTFKDAIVYGDILIIMATEGMVIYDITDPINPEYITLIN